MDKKIKDENVCESFEDYQEELQKSRGIPGYIIKCTDELFNNIMKLERIKVKTEERIDE